MFHGLILYLSLRRLRGRTVADKTGPEGMLTLRHASFSLFGVSGLANDGDRVFTPWSSVAQACWGPATERNVARRLAALAAVSSQGDDGDDGDDPVDAILRTVAARHRGEPDGPAPALSREEIEAILAEDVDERHAGRG
jgi:hypothetical protein